MSPGFEIVVGVESFFEIVGAADVERVVRAFEDVDEKRHVALLIQIQLFVDANLVDEIRDVRNEYHSALVFIQRFCDYRDVAEVYVVGWLV